MSHISVEYRGFRICDKCDIILCKINELGDCKGKPVAGAKEYIDRLKTKSGAKLETQCWICPNCHEDHSSSKPCPLFERLREALEKYRYCRHGVEHCSCTAEARAALEGK